MVAQTKAVVRPVASKAAAVDGKAVNELDIAGAKVLQHDQMAAAAVVEVEGQPVAVEQTVAAGVDADVAADVVAASGVMPTDAPVEDASIGMLAQAAPAPATDAAPAAATAAPTEAAAETTAVNPWIVGGAAVLGVGAIAAAANSGSDSPPATQPPPPPPPPPANVAPQGTDSALTLDADGKTALAASNFGFVDAGDTMSAVRIDTITTNAFTNVAGNALQYDATTGHGYQAVTMAAGTTWEQAQAAAVAAGGKLVTIDSAAEAVFLDQRYDLGDAFTTGGYFVGATQATGSAEPGEGWSWVGGAAIAAADTIWNTAQPDNSSGIAAPDDVENYGAIFAGPGNSADGLNLLLDTNASGTVDIGAGVQSLVRGYLIEYDTANVPLTLNGTAVTAGQVVAAADVANLQWNSMFNTGGAVTFSVADAAGTYDATPNTLTLSPPATATVGMMLEDPNHMA